MLAVWMCGGGWYDNPVLDGRNRYCIEDRLVVGDVSAAMSVTTWTARPMAAAARSWLGTSELKGSGETRQISSQALHLRSP